MFEEEGLLRFVRAWEAVAMRVPATHWARTEFALWKPNVVERETRAWFLSMS